MRRTDEKAPRYLVSRTPLLPRLPQTQTPFSVPYSRTPCFELLNFTRPVLSHFVSHSAACEVCDRYLSVSNSSMCQFVKESQLKWSLRKMSHVEALTVCSVQLLVTSATIRLEVHALHFCNQLHLKYSYNIVSFNRY